MEQQRKWSWLLLLVIVVVGGSGLLMYPPAKKLKLGLDLGGGTRLVYEIDVPADREVDEVKRQAMKVLRERVDPAGVKNLVWLPLAGNRFEIQMPAASPDTARKRQAYLAELEKLATANLSRGRLERALRASAEERSALLRQLAPQDEGRLAMLEALAAAHDAWEQASADNEQAQQKKDAAEKALAALGPEASEQERQKLKTELDGLLTDLTEKARRFLQTRDALKTQWDRVLATNVDLVALESALNLSAQPRRERGARQPAPSPRQQALSQLKTQHAQQAEAIERVAQAWAEYENVKGQLDDPNDLIELVRGQGVLEFRIAPAISEVPDAAEYREELQKRGPRGGLDKPFRWFVIDDPSTFTNRPRDLEALLADPAAYFAQIHKLIAEPYGDHIYLLLSNERSQTLTGADQGWKLVNVRPVPDERGLPAVGFELNTVGAQYMGQLTGRNVDRPMAIVLDGRVKSAPYIRSRISDSGQISGGGSGFSPNELNYLINTLGAGSLQGQISEYPIAQSAVSPAFGKDNLHRGLSAAVWALIAVAGFMALYYLLNGLIADFALLANLVVLLGLMALLDATFTMAGIAGVVLTIGMAVDANVLILERIREETQRGADVRTAVRLGYSKALSTIVDANLTTLITCLVLWYTATEDIKGFAATLGLGILATMFTALVGTRVLTEWYLALSGAKSLPMTPTLLPAVGRLLHPGINWVRLQPIAITFSVLCMLASVWMIYQRGEDFFDIEFRSGTQVSFRLANDQPMDIREVRQRLTQAANRFNLPNLDGNRANVMMVGRSEGTRSTAFTVATLETDSQEVSQAISEEFGDLLDVRRPIDFQGMEAGSVREAPVFPVLQADLGRNLQRPEVLGDASEYQGGVAVLIENMEPAATTTDISERIARARLQPPFDQLGYRRFTVIGLERAGEVAPDPAQQPYRSVVVLSRDAETNYAESLETFASAEDGLAATEWKLISSALQRGSTLDGVTNFSPQISETMKWNAIGAVVLSLLAVVIYIWLRFSSLRFSLAAIAALVHDVIIALGFLALSHFIADSEFGHLFLIGHFKIDLALIAAVLTIIGYSLNDTIVVFDRIRENRGRLPHITPELVNDSVNQTISRTVLTAGTTLLALFTLYLLGGSAVHGFAFMMSVGIVVGTYSSVAIAAPILLLGTARRLREESDKPAAAPAR